MWLVNIDLDQVGFKSCFQSADGISQTEDFGTVTGRKMQGAMTAQCLVGALL